MILHHFCRRNSKITLFWPQTLIFDPKSQKYPNNPQKYSKILGFPRVPCGPINPFLGLCCVVWHYLLARLQLGDVPRALCPCTTECLEAGTSMSCFKLAIGSPGPGMTGSPSKGFILLRELIKQHQGTLGKLVFSMICWLFFDVCYIFWSFW